MPFDFNEVASQCSRMDDAYEKGKLEALKQEWGDKRMKLEWCEDGKYIQMGNCTFLRHHNFKSRGAWVNYVLAHHQVYSLSSHPKWRNQAAAIVLGGSPSQLYRWFCQLQYKKFVVPYKDLLTKISFQRGRVDSKRLEQIVKHEALLRQAVKDGQTNLLPILLETGKTPQELKKELGNTWKVVCHNSLNKNKALSRTLGNVAQANRPAKLKQYAKFPTTVLENYGGELVEVMEHVTAHYKGSWGKYTNKISRELFDTAMLAQQLGRPFDPLWTPRRMKEEHDSMSKEIAARRYSPAKLECLNDVPVKVVKYEGYVATLLDSRALIAEEGNTMGHCVAGYAESVANGSYLVYSITKDGKRSSTLGINVWSKSLKSGGKSFVFGQHYGQYNKRLEDLHEKELGSIIVKELNGENNEQS